MRRGGPNTGGRVDCIDCRTRRGPQSVHVARALGMGLDEKAMEAVRQFKFKPALREGKPVACYATVEVNFRLY